MHDVQFSKRNSSCPSDLMKSEYNVLNSKLNLLDSSDSDGANYYSKRRGEIELDWLETTLCADLNYVWHACMPIPFWLSKKVFESSRIMPKDEVRILHFPLYDLNLNEEFLFEVVNEYGRAKGIETIATELYEGATSGDPRAVKMYLEVMKLLGNLPEDKVKDKLDRLLMVDIKL